MSEIRTKLSEELNGAKLSQKGNAVSKCVIDAIANFCAQNEEFAQAVMQSDGKIKDCIESTVKNCGNSISDIEVYRKAVQFYFPGADIRFNMVIDLGDGGFSTAASEPVIAPVELSLDDLLDF